MSVGNVHRPSASGRWLALALLPLLGACPPDLSTPRAYRCTYGVNDAKACAAGWYCARDGYCHARDGTDTVPCEESTASADCPTGWFCGADRQCHDGTVGSDLSCDTNDDCGAGWHCGVRGRCYERRDAGAVACRRADGGAPLFFGHDCADDWRCGLSGVCHPGADAGAIGCRYPVDSDCTSGWRCGANGVCIDPSGERLTDAGAVTVGVPLPVASAVPDGRLLATSDAPAGEQAILVLASDGRLVQVDHLSAFSASAARDETFRLRLTTVLAPGLDLEHTAVEPGQGYGFIDGGAVRWLVPPDGGVTSAFTVLDELSQPLQASQVRLAPAPPDQGRRGLSWGLFYTEGAGVVRIASPDGGIQRAPLASPPPGTLIDVVPAPTALGTTGQRTPCFFAIYADPSAGDSAFLMNGDMSPSFCSSIFVGTQGSRGLPGLFRLGPDGVLAYASLEGSLQRVELFDVRELLNGCGTRALASCNFGGLACFSACSETEVADFHPVRTPTGPGVELTCRTGAARDRRLMAPLFPGAVMCGATSLRGSALAHESDLLPGRKGPSFPHVPANGWARAAQAGGRLEPYYGPGMAAPTPWTLDRVPPFIGNMDIGFRAIGSGLDGQLTPDGIMVRLGGVGSFDVVDRVPGTAMLVSGDRFIVEAVAVRGPDGGLVDARIETPGRIDVLPADFTQPVRSLLARRSRAGGHELIVTSKDTLFSATYSGDGGMLLEPRVSFPGHRIGALAETGRADELGLGVEVWLSLGAQGLARAYERRPGQWVSERLAYDLGDVVIDVWSSTSAGKPRGRVGLGNGAILSLPSALQLTTPLDGGSAQDFLELCGEVFALDERHVYRLAPGGAAGQATWAPVPQLGGDFRGGRLFDGRPFRVFGLPVALGDELLAVERHGTVWRIPLSGCPPP